MNFTNFRDSIQLIGLYDGDGQEEVDHRLQVKQAKTLERIERQKQEAVEREMGRAAALEEKEQSLLEASMVLEDKRKVKEVRRFLTQKSADPRAILRANSD